MGRRHRDRGRSAGPRRELAGRRRLHVRHVAFSRRQELSGRRLGSRHGSPGSRRRFDRARVQDRLSERSVGRATSPTSGSGATSTPRSDSCRERRCIWRTHLQLQPPPGAGTDSADVLQSSGRELATDLSGRWESYFGFFAPLHWRFRSGERVEFNANPTGERLTEPFEVARGVVVPPGSYHWRQYKLEAGTAQKRRLYTQVTWLFGGFYTDRSTSFSGRAPGIRSRSSRWSSPASGMSDGSRPAGSRSRSSARGCASTSRRICPCRATCSTTRTANRSGSTRGSLDLHARRRPLRRLQPQRAVDRRSLAPRLQSAAGQAAVRLASLAADTV